MNDIYDAIIYGIDYIKRCKGDNKMSLHPFADQAEAFHQMIVDSCGLVVDNENGLRLVANKNGSCIDFHINKYHNILPKIKKAIFNDPYTIVLWEDNTKTIVKCQKCIGYEGWVESFDPEKGLAMAIAKKALGNTGNYYEVFKHFIPQELNCNWTTTINGKEPDDFADKVSKDMDNVVLKAIKLKNYAYPDYDQIKDEDLEADFYDRNKYGDIFDKRFYYAGKRHKIVCAGTCYHVKNIKKENAIVYATRYDAIKDGCVPCKHCSGVSIFSELHRKGCLELHKKIKEDKDN